MQLDMQEIENQLSKTQILLSKSNAENKNKEMEITQMEKKICSMQKENNQELLAQEKKQGEMAIKIQKLENKIQTLENENEELN
jgi:hypothetical protein